MQSPSVAPSNQSQEGQGTATVESTSMFPDYAIRDTSGLFSPSLLFYKDLIRRATSPAPSVPAGKSEAPAAARQDAQDAQNGLEHGSRDYQTQVRHPRRSGNAGLLRRHRVLLAYPIVGRNCRLAKLMAAYPQCRFAVLADHPAGKMAVSQAVPRRLQRWTC